MEFTRLYEALVGLSENVISPPINGTQHGFLCVNECLSFCLFRVFQHHEPMDSRDHQRSIMQLSVAMGNLTMVLKGEHDLITDGSKGKCSVYVHCTKYVQEINY